MPLRACIRARTRACVFASDPAWLSLCLPAACAVVRPLAPLPGDAEPLRWPTARSTVDSTAAATPLAAWWRHFNALLLMHLIDDALRADTSVQAASDLLVQSRAALDLQSAGWWPTPSG